MPYPRLSESNVLARQDGKPFAMGLLEERNAKVARKYARSIRRNLEAIRLEDIPPETGILYPSGTAYLRQFQPASIYFCYSYSVSFNRDLFIEKRGKFLTAERDRALSGEILATLQNYTVNPLSRK